MQNRLNDVDQARAYNSRTVSDERKLASKYENKAFNAERKGNDEKANKYRNKQEEHLNKIKTAMENIKKGDHETEELLKRLKESGKFDVSTKEILRNTDRLQDVLKNTAVAAALGLTGGIYVNSYHFSDGTKYKVKDAKKQKNKMYDNDFSEEEKNKIRAKTQLTYAKDGKASSIFSKRDMDEGKKDPEMATLLFLDLNEYNRSKLVGKEYGGEWNKEFEKFQKDPYNYRLPK